MAEEKIGILISAKDQASSIIKGVTGSFTEMNQTLELAKKAYGMVSEAIGAVIDAAAEEERQWVRVSNALKTHGLDVRTNLAEIQKMTDALEWQTGVADDLIAEGYQRMVTAGYDVKTSTSAIGLALDIAAATGMDFNAALVALIKGGADSTMQLNRLAASLGIIVKDGTPAVEIMKQINEAVNGRASADMDGYAAASTRWAVTWERFKEDIGRPFLESAALIVGGISEITRSITSWERAWINLKKMSRGPMGMFTPEEVQRLAQMDGIINTAARDLDGLAKGADGAADATTKLAKSFDLVGNFDWMAKLGTSNVAEHESAMRRLGEMDAAIYQKAWDDLVNPLNAARDAAYGKKAEFEPDADFLNYLDAVAEKTKRAREAAATAGTSFKTKFADAAMNAVRNMGTGIQNYLWGTEVHASEVFKQMAKDFTQFFINAILEDLAKATYNIVKKLLLFDVPANDAMVAQSGRDYWRHFQSGVMEGMNNNNLATVFVGAPSAPFAASSSSGGGSMGVVNQHYYGVVSEDFIRHDVLPSVSVANRRREVALTEYMNRRITGSKVFRG